MNNPTGGWHGTGPDKLAPARGRRGWPLSHGSFFPGALILCAVMLLTLSVQSIGPALAAPTRFEKREVEAQALEAFRQILRLWKEELYFELYESGMESTKKQISLEEFAQRMVELAWVPQGELNPKFLKSKFQFRTMVYVSARVEFRHKFNPDKTFFKDHTFLLLEENGTWRIDLVQLVRAPFA